MSRYFLACVLVMSLVVVFLTLYFSEATSPNRFVVLDGEFESLEIGATKTALLDVLKQHEASLIPQSGLDQEAQLELHTHRLSDEDIKVLDAAQSWRSSDVGSSTCPVDRSPLSTLRFDGDRLLRIEIVCVLTGGAADD